MSKVKDLMRRLGNEKSKKIFLEYMEKNQPKMREFIEKKINASNAGDVMTNVHFALMPMDVKVGIFLMNVSKDEEKCKKMIDEYLDENEEHALAFALNHPLCAKG